MRWFDNNYFARALFVLAAALAGSSGAFASETTADKAPAAKAESCTDFGPQTPRDINNRAGENQRGFSFAPRYQQMNLCNIHFHSNAEHKAKDFSIHAGDGHDGHGGGYQCNASKSLTAAQLKAPEGDVCKGLKPGDTIEVHWVHSSCAVKPGAGLGACLSASCANPDLRVEAQVFTLVNDPSALNFNNFAYDGKQINGLHQAKAIPTNTGKPVQFLGSTTGPKYTEQTCSPLQVSWSVRPKCAKLDINTLGEWCKSNIFKEDHAHGVRKLVVDVKQLAKIK